jgi:hypothetical protein
MRSIRSKLTYANVMSTIAVLLLLGGGAALAAGKLGKNSVGTKQLKNGAVTGAKIKKRTITGTNINLAKLGTVPSATNATTANTATTSGTANALAAPEALRLVGTSGQPAFLDGTTNAPGGPINFQPVSFFKDHDGIVHLEGVAAIGSEENPLKGLVFSLPPGFRPASGHIVVVPNNEANDVFVFGSNASIAGKNVEGDVLFTKGTGEVTLSGVTFRAAS